MSMLSDGENRQIALLIRKKQKEKEGSCIKELFKKRGTLKIAFHDPRISEPNKFCNSLRMDGSYFDELQRIKPEIKK